MVGDQFDAVPIGVLYGISKILLAAGNRPVNHPHIPVRVAGLVGAFYGARGETSFLVGGKEGDGLWNVGGNFAICFAVF